MTAETLCEQLRTGDATETLLQSAAAIPECVEMLLTAAREQMPTDSGEAIRCAQIAINLAQRRQDTAAEIRAGRLTGQAHRIQGNHAAACDALMTAAELAARTGDTRLAAQTQVSLIDSLGWMGRFDEANTLAHTLEATFRALEMPAEAALACLNRGVLHYRRDQYAPAIRCYEQAIDLLATSGDSVSQAKAQSNLAAVFMELHRMEEATALFEQARTAFLAADLPVAVAMVDANIGYLHYLSGRHGLCIAAFQAARDIFTQQNLTLEAAKCDADMAEAYRELNLHPEALDAYARAMDAPVHLPLAYERARAELGRADVLLSAGRTTDALAGLERAGSLFRAQRNGAQSARVGLQQAHIHRHNGQAALARTEARRAAATLRRNGLRGWAAEARFLLAELDADDGKHVSRSLHHVRRTARDTSRGWLECRAERALGQHYARQGNGGQALRHWRASVQALEAARTLIAPESMHVAFLSNKLPVYEAVVSALLARGRRRDIAEALEYVERAKSRLLLERLESVLQGRFLARTMPPETTARLARLRAELSQGYFRLNALDASEARRVGTTDAADRKALTTLEQEYRDALQAAESSAEQQATLPALSPVVPASALFACLRDNEILLEYYIVGDAVCAWVMTPAGIQFQPNLCSVEAVTFAARRWRYQLQQMHWGGEFAARQAQRFQTGAEDALRVLYDLLLRPIAPLLNAEKIVLVPHGLLHGLPFHAFYDGDAPALERWEFTTAPSAAIWYARARRRSVSAGGPRASDSPLPNLGKGLGVRASKQQRALEVRDALLMGIATPELPHVAEEMTMLRDILPNANVYQGDAATLAAFRAHAPQSRLLHLATHALYREDNPLFSGLQCADGWLLARDLYDMKLTCELAVLSACQTGVAFVQPGDELFGLVRGFLAAGAHTVAASLWPADDRSTACLMEHFYTHWLAGETKSAALRTAQQQTRQLYPHPYHWAAFLLVGAS